MKPSLFSKIIQFVLKVFNARKQVEKQVISKKIVRSKHDFVPKRIAQYYKVSNRTINAKAVATFESKTGGSRTHLFFLHGGAYVFEAGAIHWAFAQKIVQKINCKVSMIDYPLAPEDDYHLAYNMVGKAYSTLLEQYPNDDFIFIGDSAGAGLAMGFYQQLQLEKVQLPSKMILLSPWLDLAMSNPEAKAYEESDYLLTIKMLQAAGDYYAGNDDKSHFLLSPINGNLSDFPPTIVFYSDTELFYPDCMKLQSIVGANGNFTFKEYHRMPHDWAMFPIAESNLVVQEICDFINRD